MHEEDTETVRTRGQPTDLRSHSLFVDLQRVLTSRETEPEINEPNP